MSEAAPANLTLRADEPSASDDLPVSLPVEIVVHDRETIAELCSLTEGDERDRFAQDALRIGVLALRQARGEIDVQQIRRESDRFLTALDARLGEHARGVHDRLTVQMKEYFDPQDGRFHERVDRLIKQDGELEALMRRQIGGEDSELTRALARHIGEESELMKILSPEQSDGLLAALTESLEVQLKEQRERILGQFSLDNKEGALARFINELAEQQGEFSGELTERIDGIVDQFSLDDENSALSRLVRNVDRAQKTITNEFSLDEERSALSRLKRMLEDTNRSIHSHLSLDEKESALSRLKLEMLTILKEHSETNTKFQEEVKLSLKEMITRKQESEKSTRHGFTFEDALFELVLRDAQARGDVAVNTSNTTGLISRRVVGDCVLELGPDSLATEAKIVLEAKQDAKYTVKMAREEIELARKNRDAQIGVFVFSKRTADEGIEPFTRYGNDILVVWDAEDAGTDLYVTVALTLARALCIREHANSEVHSVDWDEITKSILEIEKRTNSLDDIVTWTNTITSANEKISEKIRKTRKSLLKQVDLLQDRMQGLKDAVGANDDA